MFECHCVVLISSRTHFSKKKYVIMMPCSVTLEDGSLAVIKP